MAAQTEKPKLTFIGLRIAVEDADFLRVKAAQKGKSKSALITDVLTRFIRTEKKKGAAA